MQRARSVAWVSLLATIVVVAIKLVAAFLSGSVSVLSEALQSLVDVAVSAMAIGTLRYVEKPPDFEHPYGHGKAELLAGAFQMLVVMASCMFIVWQASLRFSHPQSIVWDWGAAAMAYTLVSNTLMGKWLTRAADRTGSSVLRSEAIHLRGDSLTSAGVLVGMLLVGLTGWLWLDPSMAVLFAIFAMVSAWRQLVRVVHPLMDGGLPEEDVRKIEQVLAEHPLVRGHHNLMTRETGGLRQVELHVTLEDSLTFVEAHELAEEVEAALSEKLGGARVEIHYEPHEAEMEHRRTAHQDEQSRT